jgi:hypothetical protein
VLRTPLLADQMDTAQIVRSYKSLAEVECAFRLMKSVDLKIRPIHHRLADRVRAHILLCVLAHYVEWNMCQVGAQCYLPTRTNKPNSSAIPSLRLSALLRPKRKALSHTLPDGSPGH